MKQTIAFMLAGLLFFSCTASKKSKTVPMTTENKSSLTETYWRLTELMGQPVTTPEGEKEMFLMLKKDGNLVNGFAGCNGFNGTYTVQESNLRIRFSQMASTLRACLNMEKEKVFFEVLEKADNYTLQGKVLSLNKARMAPLAKFEAAVMK